MANSTYVGEESQSWKVIHPFLDSFFLSCPSFPLLSSVMLRALSLFQALLVLQPRLLVPSGLFVPVKVKTGTQINSKVY